MRSTGIWYIALQAAKKRGPFLFLTPLIFQIDSHWTDCARQSCCPGYTLITGRCISAEVDPCHPDSGLTLCEQNCAVFIGRVVCTCYNGYKFNKEKHRRGEEACEDVDECQVIIVFSFLPLPSDLWGQWSTLSLLGQESLLFRVRIHRAWQRSWCKITRLCTVSQNKTIPALTNA